MANENESKEQLTSYSALGAVCALMLKSPMHHAFHIRDLEWLVLHPLRLGQMKLFLRDNSAVGYATWAFLSDESIARLLAMPSPRLEFEDWQSGQHAWIVDLVAETSETERIKRSLREEIFSDAPVRTFLPRIENGNVVGVTVGEF